uniref:Alpha/beta hydrolase n=1 Tax=Streptomyces citricolor TaxID=212427 RepID=A0A1B4ZCB3_9ACTN|nr:alpha/beta hydrolase [Streptomyces citricolor]BAV57081.1 alpha/beta hydrolase [Streptomyces citricolor]
MSPEPPEFEELSVAVPGGDLAVLRWPATVPDAPTVVAVHGITANALAWSQVARRLAGRATLVAPDLRGRGASRSVLAPYGIGRHADDLAELIRALDLGRVRLAGHSMGAYVAALTAVRHPALVERLLLVDGAVSFPLPAGVDADDVLAAVLGPALARLSMTFPDQEAYLAFWRGLPAFAGEWIADYDAYALRDLTGTEGELRSACVPEAIREDGRQVLLDADVTGAIHRLPCPAELLWAERGLQDELQGLYDPVRLKNAALDPATVVQSPVPGTNHYTILMGRQGAAVVAGRLLAGEPVRR